MLKLIIYQFQYSKRQWFGTIPLLFVSSLIVGTSLIGMASASQTSQATPVQLFQMLIFFGGLTLFFLVSNSVRLLIDIFKKDYQLWAILGASKSQLSLLIAGQFFLMALLTSIVGTFCSLAVADAYYTFLQNFLGRKDLPDLIIQADPKTLIMSILLVPIIVGVSAYFYSGRILTKKSSSKNKLRKHGKSLTRLLSILVALVLWLGGMGLLLSASASNSFKEISSKTAIILYLLIIHLWLIQILTPSLQFFLLKCGLKIFPPSSYAFNTASWNLLYAKSYFKSLQTSVTMGVTLISGFILYTQNMYSFLKTANSIGEARASFIAYMSTPILLILASIITMTILTSNQDKKDVAQLQVLGASKKQLLRIRLAEAIIHALLILLISAVFNTIILVLVNYSGHLLKHNLVTVTGFWLPGLVILGLMSLFYMTTKGLYVLKAKP